MGLKQDRFTPGHPVLGFPSLSIYLHDSSSLRYAIYWIVIYRAWRRYDPCVVNPTILESVGDSRADKECHLISVIVVIFANM